METIDSIIIHCSATRAGQNLKAKDIDRMHRARNFDMIGYHFVIDLDGTIEKGRPLSMIVLIVIQKALLECHITNIVLAYAISED